MSGLVRLGQNFLADPNLLDAIVRDAGLAPDDVVLEVGAGEGVLTDGWPAVAAPSTRSRSTAASSRRWRRCGAARTSSLHWGDAMRLDLAALEPPPTAMVANLPYSVATPLILRTIEQLPSLATLDRDGPARDRRPPARGARAAASTARPASSPSSPARSSWSARSTRPSSGRGRGSTRRSCACAAPGPAADAATRELVRAAFAHRRKRWPARWSTCRPGSLAPARAALRRARPARGRARRGARRPRSSPRCRRSCKLTPEPDRTMRLHAPAKLNLCLYLGPRPRRRPARALLAVRAAGPGRPDLGQRGRARRGRLPGSRGREPGRAGAGRRCAPRAGSAPPLRIEIEKRVPVAAGLGGGSADAAAVLRLAAGEVADLPAIAARLGADVPSQLRPALALVAWRRRVGRAAARAGRARRRAAARRRRPRHR